MRAQPWVATGLLFGLLGCADVWGFQDVSLLGDAGVESATTVASFDATSDSHDARSDREDSATLGEGGEDSSALGETGADGNVSLGQCRFACNATTGTPSCNAVTCSYSCQPGRSDCNAGTAPDVDGCECQTSGCCGPICQTKHSNGEGQTFADCTALGTFDQTQATAACAAFTGSPAACTESSGCCGSGCPRRGTPVQSVCGANFGMCLCWQHAGAAAGTVQTASGPCTATCGSAGDPSWN